MKEDNYMKKKYFTPEFDYLHITFANNIMDNSIAEEPIHDGVGEEGGSVE